MFVFSPFNSLRLDKDRGSLSENLVESAPVVLCDHSFLVSSKPENETWLRQAGYLSLNVYTSSTMVTYIVINLIICCYILPSLALRRN